MTAKGKKVLEASLGLSEKDRLELADTLYTSLGWEEFDEEFQAEIERRIDDVASGREKTIPHQEVMASLRKEMKPKKRHHDRTRRS